jgi:23S rRNA (uracil1939-C5)-methyltransferase
LTRDLQKSAFFVPRFSCKLRPFLIFKTHTMQLLTATIESLDQEGRGIARRDGKTIFVEGALTGETVAARITRAKPTYEQATTEHVISANPGRVTPACAHFGVCGGCSMQHAHLTLQVAAKARVLEDALSRIGNVTPEQLLPAIYGPAWGYRYRARLSVRYVEKKGTVLVGFHERRSSYVADMRDCKVLPQKIADLLVPLRELVGGLSLRDRLPQIELAVGENPETKAPVFVLVLRLLETLNDADAQKLRDFADTHDIHFWTQYGGPDTATPFYPEDSALFYTLPEFDVSIPFLPTDFTQVNHQINRVLVGRALKMLAPQKGERIADFFCGLGNFTLPIARSGAQVNGIEGNRALVERAEAAALKNGLSDNTEFTVLNLFENVAPLLEKLLPLDKVLIDPPREGAVELVKGLPAKTDKHAVKRIVYVSCNPATLARDAAILVHEKGYTLKAAGIVNMFPHTAHVESMGIFE